LELKNRNLRIFALLTLTILGIGMIVHTIQAKQIPVSIYYVEVRFNPIGLNDYADLFVYIKNTSSDPQGCTIVVESNELEIRPRDD
jgi:accessory gene regulator protein AgrB